MIWMDVDTTVIVPANILPLIDSGDFLTRETGVAYDAAGIEVWWNFITTSGTVTRTAITLAFSGSYAWGNRGAGMYVVNFPDTGGGSVNNDTEGFGWISGDVDGVLPFSGPEIGFRAAAINNALIDDAFDGVRGFGSPTALPNANADAAGGLPVSDVGGLDLDNIPKQIDRNMDLAQHMRGFHTHQGDIYYVAPINGNDTTGDGTRALPYKTLQNAMIDLVTDSNHDTIIVLADHASTATTHTSTSAITCNKRYVSILGPGRDLIVTRSNSGNIFEITADGVEISGFQIGTHDQGAGNGIDIAVVDFHRIHNCWFLDTQGDGIHCERGSNCQFHDNHFEGTGVTGSGQGIHITGAGGAGNANDNVIRDNHFAATDGTAILLDGGTTDDTVIHHNTIHNAGAGDTGYGIDITSSSTNAQVYENTIGNSADGDIRDNGTTSIIKNNTQWLDSTVESRSLDVTSTGAAGIDWGNVENKTTVNDFSATDIQLCDTITTYTGNTKQTGDNFARIGAGGANLGDLGGMSTAMKAEVKSESNDALVALKLDHLVAVADSDDPVDDSIIAKLAASDGDWSGFSEATDSLEAIRDRGDAAWTTGAASGEGAYTGTLTVDDGTTGLEGAVVNATRGGVLIATGTTDSSGEITDWVFDSNTYTLAVRLTGYQPETDTVVVTGNAWTKTISLTAITISSPSAPTLCTIGFLVKLSDTAVSGAVCRAKLQGINQASDGTILSNAKSSDTTDSEGVAELELVRKDSIVKGGGVYAIWIEIDGKPVASIETTIPNQSTISFEDLLES